MIRPKYGWWGGLDTLSHKLPLPRPIQRWICNRFDHSLGADNDDPSGFVDLPAQEEDDGLVCVLCGAPWLPKIKNVCECGGFCTWGPALGAEPSSWTVTAEGWIPNPPPEDLVEWLKNDEPKDPNV